MLKRVDDKPKKGRPRMLTQATAPAFTLPADIAFAEARPMKSPKLMMPSLMVKWDGNKLVARLSLPQAVLRTLHIKANDRIDWRQGITPNERYLKVFLTRSETGLALNETNVTFSIAALIDPAKRRTIEACELPFQTIDDARAIILELPEGLVLPKLS